MSEQMMIETDGREETAGKKPEKDGGRFETAYQKLKELADRMQDPSTGLEESIRCYEEGMHYYRICTDILHDAKQQIETYRIGPEETDQ